MALKPVLSRSANKMSPGGQNLAALEVAAARRWGELSGFRPNVTESKWWRRTVGDRGEVLEECTALWQSLPA